MTGLEAVLVVGAFVAGLTGSWSPCGFSMVETIGPTGHGGGLRTTASACATFTAGALAGGVATFTALAAIGLALHPEGAGVAELAAGAVALAAALAEARGTRVLPQVRRQVPEHWRRVVPMPLAAGLYGVLLGLGFTTFVLTFAVWALAGMSVALGDPALGIAVGLAFGAGRALPVVAMAPLAGRPAGIAVTELMAERVVVLRGFRLANAAALALCALVLLPAGASAATLVAQPASDPAVAGTAIVWQQPAGGGVLRDGGRDTPLPGSDAAIGGALVAWRAGSVVSVARRADLVPVAQLDLPGVNELAVSDAWLAYRMDRGGGGGDHLVARRLADLSQARLVATARPGVQLGRPALDGSRLVFHVAGSRGSRIVRLDLGSGRRRTLARSRSLQLLNPSVLGGAVLYTAQSRCGQELRLTRGRRERRLLRLPPPTRRDRGHEQGHTRQGRAPAYCGRPGSGTAYRLWTTALSERAAYVTRLGPGGSQLLRVSR